ncbi:unnamed protein product [Cyprideis torosa]|uniref:Insulin-degrading enzyme n=1 Tax=Cyprideis torosa TaxID=163714 RepID=A0A7R8W9B8_9CRUS|nr:unnamed protein product [Cyprideis torosa]CAG0887165.1 unnamed protein product [Cyprideis torosa]
MATKGIVKRLSTEIIKSPHDKCLYRGLMLENGLKVVLISDKETDMSAAALDVNVGHMSDPDELPGLAHFCEHMLFLGTKKYPLENDYSKFLSEHGGSSNAYTTSENTCFYFDVAPDSLFPALDRFAQFFLEPLFNESATEREANAVNSEHQKNIPDDTWRVMEVQKLLAKEGHPFRKFGTGNIDTLLNIPRKKGIDTRKALLDFHDKWYSANIMTLAVFGKEDLDELESEVLKHFSKIVNKNVEKPSWPEHPYGPNEVGKILEIVPLRWDNIILRILAKEVKDERTPMIEQYHGTEYFVSNIPKSFLEELHNFVTLNNKLSLPSPNEFIPTNFELAERQVPVKYEPELIEDSAMYRIWFMQDNTYKLPKADVRFEIIIPCVEVTPLAAMLSGLFTWLFRDAMTELTYDADLAGLSYNLSFTWYGLSLDVSGFNHRLVTLLDTLLNRMRGFKPDPERFVVVRELFVRQLENFKMNQPHSHATYYLDYILLERGWSVAEKLACVNEVTLEAMNNFLKNLFDGIFVEALLFGNLDRQNADEILQCVKKHFKDSKPLLTSQLARKRLVKLEEGSSMLFYHDHEVHPSSCTMAYYQTFTENIHNNVVIELFHQIIHEPVFDQLRTKEQLGYIVWAQVKTSCGVKGLSVTVQSEFKPEFLNSRIEAFLLQAKTTLEQMSDQDFQFHVEALATRRLERPKTMRSFASKMWSEIYQRYYFFNRDEREVAHLRTLRKKDILQFYDTHLNVNSEKRRKLSVFIVSAPLANKRTKRDTSAVSIDSAVSRNLEEPLDQAGFAAAPKEPPATIVTDVHEFKASKALYPRPKPYIAIPLYGGISKL